MKLADRSLKAKEKFADGLMSVANALHIATFVGVLIFPLTTFLSALSSSPQSISILNLFDKMAWPQIFIFAIVYLVPIVAGQYAKDCAMDLYDEIEKRSSNPSVNRTLRIKLRNSRYLQR